MREHVCLAMTITNKDEYTIGISQYTDTYVGDFLGDNATGKIPSAP